MKTNKIIIGIVMTLLMTSGVMAMNLRISSWLPKYDNTRNYSLILNQGDNLDKVCSLGIFSSSCYFSEWSSGDPQDYNLDVTCEGTGCQFMRNMPEGIQFLVNGTSFKQYWSLYIPLDAKTGTYGISLCGTICDPTQTGGIGMCLGGCGNDVFIINGTDKPEPICQENWSCSYWNKCKNKLQTRTCTDLNSCGTINTKPIETQKCSMCIPEWKCTDWQGQCKRSSSTLTRTCLDLNHCRTNQGKPAVTKRCGVIVNGR